MALYERPARLKIINDNTHKSYEEYMNERSFRIVVEENETLVRLFAKHNWTRRGQHTWSLHASPNNENSFTGFVMEYAQIFSLASLSCNAASAQNVTYSFHYPNRSVNQVAQPYIFNSSGSIGYASALHANVRGFFAGSRRLGDVEGYRDILGGVPNEIYEAMNKKYRGYGSPEDLKETHKIIGENLSPIILEGNLSHNTFYFTLKYSDEEYFAQEIGEEAGLAGFPLVLNDFVTGRVIATKTYATKHLYHHEIMEKAFNIEKVFPGVVDFSDYEADYEKGKNSYFMSTVSGQPTKVALFRGSNEVKGLKKPRKTRKFNFNKPMDFEEESVYKLSLAELEKVKEKNPNATFVAHPSFSDIQQMLDSEPYEGESRLYGYQRKAVGLQLSTNIGFLNSLDTGIGKSIVQLTAMRERAKTIPNYRGLIVCQSNTRKQWVEYMKDDGEAWFPEAQTFILDSSKKMSGLIQALSQTGPVVVVATFNMIGLIQNFIEEKEEFQSNLKEANLFNDVGQIKELVQEFNERDLAIGELLHDMFWNDICADEAMSIRSGNSKQRKALWAIRPKCERATALTATPFNKSIDDITSLIEWVRNDRSMFYGSKLSTMYDQENIDEKTAIEIFNGLFPMVFRFTKEEAENEEKDIKIPKELMPESIILDPTPEEKALSHACEYELKRILNEFEVALENVEANSAEEKEELDKAREELKEAHGHWMAGTNLARMATSNPASILKSESVAAQLLTGQGLVHAAMESVPTKQRVLLERSVEHVQKGQQMLVFTDFVDVAETLQEAYTEIGIRAGVFGSKNVKKRDENRIAFQNGELDVLICTKAAERGLTLHKASVTYHYDISWTLEPLLQKAGRAARVGSENEEVETYFLILKGTIEEKVVEKVFTQGTLASMVLDKARGIDIANTTTGKLMGGLTNASQNIRSRRGALEFGKALLGG